MEINVIRWLLTLLIKYTGNYCVTPVSYAREAQNFIYKK